MWKTQPSSNDTWRGRGRGGGGRGGSWSRGGRGGGPKPKPATHITSTTPAPPLGKLLSSLTKADLNGKEYEATSSITDCKTVSSYNWLDRKTPTIVVPGKPPRWTPLKTPTPLKQDNGNYWRDPNAAHSPKHPMEAAAMAVLAMEPHLPQELDVVACSSTLGNLLRFIRGGEDKKFRALVELVGDTVFFIRRENSPRELIPDVRGYGHSFPESYTTWDAEVKGSDSYQRLITYRFGGLDFLVRFEADGYIANNGDSLRVPSALPDLDAKAAIDELTFEMSRNGVAAEKLASDATAVKMTYAGELVKQECIFELKTRTIKKKIEGEDTFSEQIPRLWVAQIPKFILAYHTYGVFDDINIEPVDNRVQLWEMNNMDVLSRLAALIHRIVDLIRDRPDGKLELRHESMGVLEVREQLPDGGNALSDSVKKLWEKGWVGEDDAGTVTSGSDENGEESDEIDWDDGPEPDYTACSAEDCGYCGRCSY